MMLRVLLLVLLAGLGAARASDKIDAPAEGASKPVTQPHVTAELIPEMTTVATGKPFGMILHLHMDPGWHVYWINPGDAGIPTTIKWTLPAGFTAGPILWPVPEKHAMGPLVTYGYDGDVYLLTTITPPATGDLPEHLDVKAKAEWLVCQEECIPGKAELAVTLDSGMLNFRLPMENTELFKAARARLPVENQWYSVVSAKYTTDNPPKMVIKFRPNPDKEREGDSILIPVPKDVRFFPGQPNVLGNLDVDNPPPVAVLGGFTLTITLQQNGAKPDKLSGVLVSNGFFMTAVGGNIANSIGHLPGDITALSVPEFPVTSDSGAGPAPVTQSIATPTSGANATEPVARRSTATTATDGQEPVPPTLIAVLGAAFVGGLILNLMPCVLPVLSLKVFSLIKHAGEHPEKAWRQGAAFTAGVVISFWALAGLLLGLRAAGNQLGWGFQMQSPGFVAALIVLFFLIGLNLFGVFEIGTSLVGLDAKTAGRTGGGFSSFLNGALATLAATPCTAPFMGSALGFAAQQSVAISLLIFTFLALGMAAPYLLLTIFPQSLRFVPKPGAWMESLKQFMGFLLMGTVIFLLYVFGALVGNDQITDMLGVLLFLGLAAWVYGRWGGPEKGTAFRVASIVVCLIITIVAVSVVMGLSSNGDDPANAAENSSDGHRPPLQNKDGWQEWSPEAVEAALKSGQPVFVDFTAAWCLSCKVNERVALDTDVTKKAFADKNVALFRADWTHADPKISQALQQYHRDGVPLYLLYSPKAPDAPQVLPEVLTQGIVLDALGKI